MIAMEETRPLVSIPAEVSVLGAMLLNESRLEDGLAAIDESDFYRPAHRLIFHAMKSLKKDGFRVDELSVEQKLVDTANINSIGGRDYLIDIGNYVPSSGVYEHAAETMLDKSRLRRLEALAKELIGKIHSAEDGESPADMAAWIVSQTSGIGGSGLGFITMADIDENGGDDGISTGFKQLDRRIATRGMPLGQMTMFIAQEKHGKSTAMLGVSLDQARAGYGVLYVSLADLNPKRLKRRFLRCMSGYSERLTADRAGFSEDFLNSKSELERDLDLTLYDRTKVGSADVDRIIAAVESFRQRKERTSVPLRTVYIDYVQKLKSKEFRPSDDVAMANYCSGQLSAYAERSGLAIGAGSQLTDGNQKAGTRAITKGSRAWLEDCGLALQLEMTGGQSAVVEIARSRFGGMGTKVPLIFDEDRLRFNEVNG